MLSFLRPIRVHWMRIEKTYNLVFPLLLAFSSFEFVFELPSIIRSLSWSLNNFASCFLNMSTYPSSTINIIELSYWIFALMILLLFIYIDNSTYVSVQICFMETHNGYPFVFNKAHRTCLFSLLLPKLTIATHLSYVSRIEPTLRYWGFSYEGLVIN